MDEIPSSGSEEAEPADASGPAEPITRSSVWPTRHGEEDTGGESPTVTHAPGSAPVLPLARVILVCLAAWLVPGAGHLLVGRRGRAAVFAVLIAALFFGGLALDGLLYRPVSGDPLSYLAALGGSGAGALYLCGQLLGWGTGAPAAPYFEYGNTFTLAAGLLNLLIVLDAFDFAVLGAKAALQTPEIGGLR